MKILDTDLLISFLKNGQAATKKIKYLMESGEKLITTVFNSQEIAYGPYIIGNLSQFQKAMSLMKSIIVLDYQLEDMLQTIKVKGGLSKVGKPISFIDEMIAGMCLRHNATIITRNVEHFSRIPGLKIEKW